MDLDRQDDAALLARVGRGDAAAFAALVRRHQRAVVAVAWCATGSRALAEDLAQEAFVKAWRNSSDVREPDKLAAWLCGIVRFLARDHTRLEARRRALGARFGEPPATGVPTPLDDLDARERERLVAGVVAELPESYREPLLLHYLDGRSLPQVARALELTEDAVKQRLSRGRRALRDALARLGVTEARFAGAALGLAPGLDFTRRVVVTATGQPPPPSTETFMHAHRLTLIGLAAVLATAGGIALAANHDDHATASERAATPVEVARAAPPTTTPPPTAAKSAATPAERRLQMDARLRAIRQARAAAATTAAPREMVYDFAGELLSGGPSAPSSTPPADPATAFTKAGIRAALGAIRPQLRACYDAALIRTPGLAGTVALQFTVEGDPGLPATVSEPAVADAQTTIADPALRACMVDAVLDLEVPAPDAGLTVHVFYPYDLRPAS